MGFWRGEKERMIDINHIINMEILKARMSGMNDLATELLEISKTGTNVSEWIESREKVIERLYAVQSEYRKFLQDLNNGEY